MLYSKTTIGKVQEIYVECMGLIETFQVVAIIKKAAIIKKLLYGWKDFKNYLKHKCEEVTLEDLLNTNVRK